VDITPSPIYSASQSVGAGYSADSGDWQLRQIPGFGGGLAIGSARGRLSNNCHPGNGTTEGKAKAVTGRLPAVGSLNRPRVKRH